MTRLHRLIACSLLTLPPWPGRCRQWRTCRTSKWEQVVNVSGAKVE